MRAVLPAERCGGGRRLLKRIVEALVRIEIQCTKREEAFGQLGAIAGQQKHVKAILGRVVTG